MLRDWRPVLRDLRDRAPVVAFVVSCMTKVVSCIALVVLVFSSPSAQYQLNEVVGVSCTKMVVSRMALVLVVVVVVNRNAPVPVVLVVVVWIQVVVVWIQEDAV